MVSLDDKVRALAVTAGWKTPRPGQDGSYSFRLEDGLDLKVFSPDGRLCFLLADLHALPEPGHERDSLLRKVAGQQAGICRERASVVALERQEDAAARGLDGEAQARFMREEAGLWLDEGPMFGPEGAGFERFVLACPRRHLEKALERLDAAVSRRGLPR